MTRKNKGEKVEAPGIERGRSRENTAFPSYGVAKPSSAGRLSARSDVDARAVDRHLDQPTASAVNAGRDTLITKLAAKARIVEAMASGDLRVLAGELREGLEALDRPSGAVVSIRGRSS